MASANPLIGDDPVKTDQNSSRPSSKKIRKSPSSSSVTNEKMIDGEIVPSKTRQSSNTSQQRATITDQKTNVPSAHKGNTRTSRQNSSDQNKKDSRRSSTDNDFQLNDKRQSSLQKRSGQQSRKGSNKTTDSKKSGKVI